MFSQGTLFLPISSVFSRVCFFNLIVSYLFPQGIQSQSFLIVFYVLSGSGSGSPGGTTPSILVPSAWVVQSARSMKGLGFVSHHAYQVSS